MPSPPRYRAGFASSERLEPVNTLGEVFREPAPRRRSRWTGIGLLAVAAAALVIGLLWPAPPTGPIAVNVPADTGRPATTTDSGATALAQSFVAALNQRNVPLLGQLTCETGVTAQDAEQRLLNGSAERAELTGPVNTTGESVALMRLSIGEGAHRISYAGTVSRVNGSWCVSALLPQPGN